MLFNGNKQTKKIARRACRVILPGVLWRKVLKFTLTSNRLSHRTLFVLVQEAASIVKSKKRHKCTVACTGCEGVPCRVCGHQCRDLAKPLFCRDCDKLIARNGKKRAYFLTEPCVAGVFVFCCVVAARAVYVSWSHKNTTERYRQKLKVSRKH